MATLDQDDIDAISAAVAALLPAGFATLTINSGGVAVNSDVLGNALATASALASARSQILAEIANNTVPLPLDDLQLHLDAFDESTFDKIRVAKFASDAGNPQFLSVSDAAVLDVTDKFTVEFWVNKDQWTEGLGETYVAKASASGNRSWWIFHGSSFQDEHDLQVRLYSTSDVESMGRANFTSSEPSVALWSHCVVVYDGAGATNADRLKIYLDGIEQSLTFTGTIPATLKNSTAPLTIGRALAETAWRLTGRMSRVRYWSSALTSGNVSTLWNDGEGRLAAYILGNFSSGLIGCWDLTEKTGSRLDASTNALHLTVNGNITSCELVTEWRDKSANGYVFFPGFSYAAPQSGDLFFGRAPEYNLAAANGMVIKFAKTHKLLAYASQPFAAASGELLMVYRKDGSFTGEQFPFMVSSGSTATQYMGLLIEADDNAIWRIRDTTAGFDTTIQTDSFATTGKLMLSNWVGFGTGGTNSYQSRTNLVADAITTVGTQDKWFPDITDRDVIGIGTLTRSDVLQGAFDWSCGSIVVYGPYSSVQRNRQAEDHLRLKHGIASLAELSQTAIEIVTDKLDAMLVIDGGVWQYTANALELAPSGAGGGGDVTVNVLPAVGIVANRAPGATLTPVVGETISQAITLYQTDGTTPVSLAGKTLAIVFETVKGVDVAVVANDDIVVSGASSNIVTFAYPSAVTASERILRFAIRDAAAPLTMYLQGLCAVGRAPQVDA